MNDKEFIGETIGKPWVNRATGPESYDCWGLVIKSFELIDCVTLPTVAGYIESSRATHKAIGSEAEQNWWLDSDGCEGDVACYYDHKNRFTHVGRIICGGVLHCSGLSGVGAVKWERKDVVSSRFSKTEYKKYNANY